MLTVYLGSRFCWNNFFFRNIIIICGIFCFKMSKYMLSLTSSIRLTEYIPKSVIHANNTRESVLWISNDSFFLVSLRLMNGYLQIVTISNLMYIRVKELEHKILLINTNKTEYPYTPILHVVPLNYMENSTTISKDVLFMKQCFCQLCYIVAS